MFESFSLAFPPESKEKNAIDAVALVRFVETEFGVRVPQEVKDFWESIGSGYFGGRVIYVFGDDNSEQPRDSFQTWNKKDFWSLVYPPPKEGGPIFFAETCFGDQLGFRWNGADLVYVLFCVDTFDAFSVARSGEELFEHLLVDRYALLDEQRLEKVMKKLGSLQVGMHYAPLVSPIIGGADTSENFCFETPNVHFRTAIATFHASQKKG